MDTNHRDAEKSDGKYLFRKNSLCVIHMGISYISSWLKVVIGHGI